ncbi:MAG: hypothetical protein ACI4PO_10795 [Faecousia sp.]
MVPVAEFFRQQGIRLDIILDEGGAITTGMVSVVTAPNAMVARIDEKPGFTALDDSRFVADTAAFLSSKTHITEETERE